MEHNNSPLPSEKLQLPQSPRSVNRDMSHRQSFSERGIPSSPRQRHASLSQQAIQDLINNPPVARKDESRFAGRDWRSITLGEIIVAGQVRFVEADSSIEAATKVGTCSTSELGIAQTKTFVASN